VPFDPVTTPTAAQVQALYATLKRIQILQNTVPVATARLAPRHQELITAQTALAAANAERDAVSRQLFIARADDSPIPPTGPSTLNALGMDAERRNIEAFDRLVRAVTEAEKRVGAAREAAVEARTALTTMKRDLAAQFALAAALRAQVDTNAKAATVQAAPVQAAPGRPLLQPVDGRLTSPFGNRYDPYYHVYQLHAGLDLAAPAGTPIRAAAGGTVLRAGWFGGYGRYTCVGHGAVREQRMMTCYGHQLRILVQPGQQVAAGQVIGLVGSTGASTGPHLHFEVRLGGRPVDPRPWF
jgi:murein DD-endopeptidase MepM/ murein hydrolase activator NlpD